LVRVEAWESTWPAVGAPMDGAPLRCALSTGLAPDSFITRSLRPNKPPRRPKRPPDARTAQADARTDALGKRRAGDAICLSSRQSLRSLHERQIRVREDKPRESRLMKEQTQEKSSQPPGTES